MKAAITSIFEFMSKPKRSLSMIQPNMQNYAIALALFTLIYASGCGVNNKEWNLNTLFEKSKDKFKNNSLVGAQEDNTRIVATSQIIDPAGETISFPGRPVDLALNNSGTVLAVKNISSIVFMSTEKQSVMQTLKLPAGGNSFTGIIWSADDQKVWTTDTQGYLRSAKLTNGSYAWDDAILLPGPNPDDKSGPYPGGLTIDDQKGYAYVALSRTNTLGIVNLKTKQLESQIRVGIAPYTVLIHENTAYVSNWGGRQPVSGDKTGPSGGSNVIVDPKTGIASSGTVILAE
jgi:DNA-binding beta-propeller fold protein YncE